MNSKSEEEINIINAKKAHSIDSYMLRGFDKETAILMLSSIKIKTFSKESKDFFESNFIISDKIKYADSEWYIYCKESRRRYFYDFADLDNKIIVEYHGEAFHPNIKVLSESELNSWKHPYNKNITSIEVNLFDIKKRKLAESYGFRVFEIYSNDTVEVKQNLISEINLLLTS
jgi:hypothetical protein